MEGGSLLKDLLQLQLASDSSAVIHLPYVLAILNQDCFAPNSHLAKWSARLNSLFHSKEPGARWAGLCIAHKSFLTSKSFMVESASGWLPIVLPMLPRAEPIPILKAAIRLLTTVFTLALEMSEFQRQISLQYVPKFTAALSNLAATHNDVELKEYCLDTLASLMPIYPNAHRATFSNLCGLALGFLNGNYPRPTSTPLMEAAARLYSILHLTGGKVGAANLWRKALDDNLIFGWEAFFALRTTFPSESAKNSPQQQGGEDPAVSIPLNVDRIRCCSVVIRELLATMTTRPVQIPCGQLVKYAVALLSTTTEGQIEGFIDPTTRAMEVAIVPSLWGYGCEIIIALAESVAHYLEPNLNKIYTALVCRLEQPLTPSQRAAILAALQKLLESSRFVDAPILPNRIVRAVLPNVIVILSTSANAPSEESNGKSKKGKKKAKNYAGDEIFKVSRDVICPTEIDAKILLSVLEVVRYCIRNPNISNSQLSLASRVLLSIQLSLAQLSPSIFSPNPQTFLQVQKKVHAVCTEVASTSTVSLQKTLPLLVRESINAGDTELQAVFALFLHPRLPPIVRPIPTLQSLSLFRIEESEEEAAARTQLRLEFADVDTEAPNPQEQDAVMQDNFSTVTDPKELPNDTVAIQRSFLNNNNPPSSTQTPKPLPTSNAWQNDEPRPQDPIVANQGAAISSAALSTGAKGTRNELQPQSDDEEEEEIPTIDMGSDSEDEA